MKLKRYNPTSAPTTPYKYGATLNVNSRRGNLGLSNRAADAIGVAPGDKIEFLQDEENPENWYILKSDEGFTINRSIQYRNGMYLNSIALTRKIVASLGYEEGTTLLIPIEQVSAQIEGQPLFPLITRLAKVTTRQKKPVAGAVEPVMDIKKINVAPQLATGFVHPFNGQLV